MSTATERPTAGGGADGATPVQPRLGALGTLRFAWRQLTSMRTALFLLLLLAVAAVPGSVLPQRGLNPEQVDTYLREHRTTGPWLDRIGGFDVYSSVWFSAIYLLLFISLVGCVLPRTRLHLRAMRAQPPAAPRRFSRMPAHRKAELGVSPADGVEAARVALRARRYRVVVTERADGTHELSAERGYLRETGNLVFHLALVMLLVAVAAGHLLGWRGDVIVPVGETFSNATSNYATRDFGPWVDDEALSPFSVKVDAMDVTFETDRSDPAQFGSPRDFRADVTSSLTPGAPTRDSVLRVNHPLDVGDAKVFLLGNGYAPVVTVRDAEGRELYSQATPFLPQDGNYTSVGVVNVVAAEPQVVALQGLLLPTAAYQGDRPVSIFPAPDAPALALQVFVGELGQPPSVYTLDSDTMKPLTNEDGSMVRMLLEPGQTMQLPGGRGSVTFDRVERFAGLSVRHDPGREAALAASIAAMVGLSLSLFVPRRRVFVRARPDRGDDGRARTVVEVAALARGEDTGLDDELHRLLEAIGARQPQTTFQEAPA
ncbi:MAG TPA: cytochrome c biogenesis protein ResB [Actinomycetales bacterium]